MMAQIKPQPSDTGQAKTGQRPGHNTILWHVADHNNRYISEQVCFFTRLAIQPNLTKRASKEKYYAVVVQLPRGLELLDYSPLQSDYVDSVQVADSEDGIQIRWRLAAGLKLAEVPAVGRAGQDMDQDGSGFIELQVCAQISLPQRGTAMAQTSPQRSALTSTATLRDARGQSMHSDSATVRVREQSALMRYLPEIYQGNDFLGRFLMLFESFHKPMELQIEGSENYYDASLAPANILPWLASWIGFQLDPNLPEIRQRQLMNAAFSLYRRRGTRQALIEYLKLFTGGQVRIIEHRAFNLKLGRASRLGAASALGVDNRPHTFSASINLPRSYLRQFYGLDQNPGQNNDESDMRLLEKNFQRQLENLIDTQKPAHTGYNLTVKFTDD